MKNNHFLDALIHAPAETCGLISEIAAELGLEIREHHLYRGDPLPKASEIHCLIVMGGPMNVDESDIFPFLPSEIALIKNCLSAKRPMLGICLGSQLIAKALGSRVFANPVREVGWHPITLLSSAAHDPLFSACPKTFNVFHWHGDTFNLPVGATLLATTPQCQNQAYCIQSNVYGFQFHLEVTPTMLQHWVADDNSEAYIRSAGENPDQIANQTGAQFRDLEPLARNVIRLFLSRFVLAPNTTPR